MNVLLMYSPSPSHLDELVAAAPFATFSIAKDEESARQFIREADAVLGNRYFLQSIADARRLKWFQSNSVGMDLVLRAGDLLRSVTVTNARGVYSDEMAEHAVALVLSLFRRLHQFRDDQSARLWKPKKLETVSGSTFLILGWGSVGSAIGKRLHALGGKIRGAGRSKIVEVNGDGSDVVMGGTEWRALLPQVDCLVMSLPLTPETNRIVGAEEIALLRRTAHVVNVGRGKTLDLDALLEALNDSRIASAAIDVFDEEPVDENSPMWSVPSLMITPHVARSREEEPPFRWESLFVENLRRFAAGLPLLNAVDLDREY